MQSESGYHFILARRRLLATGYSLPVLGRPEALQRMWKVFVPHDGGTGCRGAERSENPEIPVIVCCTAGQ